MPLIRARILLGKTQLGAPSRPFPAATTLQHVVNVLLMPYADVSVKMLEAFPSIDEQATTPLTQW